MDSYHFGSHPPPPIPAYHQPQPYLGSPHHSLINGYQPNMTPYTVTNEYITPHPSQMYFQQQPPIISSAGVHPSLTASRGLPPYGHPLYDEEPSCFESFLETFCCCFGFGVPRNQYEAMQKYRRLQAKEERHRLAQFQKIQEKQREALIQQQQQQLAAKNNNTAKTTTSTTPNNQQTATTTTATTV